MTAASQHARFTLTLLVAALACGWIAVALLPTQAPGFDLRALDAAILGTLFGHATLAGVWTALGPWPRLPRWMFCLGWMVALALAVFIKACLDRASYGGTILAAIFGQWIAVQIPLRLVRWRRGVRIGQPSSSTNAPGPSELQFGIGQLMILTAIVGIVLAVGRAVVPLLDSLITGTYHDVPVFVFIVFTNIVLAVPLVLGALLARQAIPACTLGLVFVGLATAGEVSLLHHFLPRGGRIDFGIVVMFWIMNYCQAAWALLAIGLLRYGGYRLVVVHPTNQS